MLGAFQRQNGLHDGKYRSLYSLHAEKILVTVRYQGSVIFGFCKLHKVAVGESNCRTKLSSG